MTPDRAVDAAIEAAAEATESHHIDFDQADADGYNPCICGQWRDGGEGGGWDEHMADIAVRAAEPILRQAERARIVAFIRSATPHYDGKIAALLNLIETDQMER